MSSAAALVRRARHEAGLTQVDLAHRLGMSQAAVARLERAGSNPTVRTLRRVLRAAGRDLVLGAEPAVQGFDEEQLRRHLRVTPAERLRLFEVSHRNLEDVRRRVRPAD